MYYFEFEGKSLVFNLMKLTIYSRVIAGKFSNFNL